MAVDPLFAQWLQADSDNVVRTDNAATARWGASALTTERVTGIANFAAATVEADREVAFFSRGPFAVDLHTVVGTDWQNDLGHVVTFISDQLGYDGGVDVFVTGVEMDQATGITIVTVLRPLRGVA
ncbi:hypothetical protein [Sphingomonas sp. CROZ-RG-20F-R02-07]|uniref:hypothetical protein n=1 Tax=Sphingomonas sp. CROZ-RG-20F-R02-07 TaxID=2914832 RepID=UPI001F59CF9A|nr:hypothetical protein [Sphingomonas sp. CROZ-RG-20F-R02-07]